VARKKQFGELTERSRERIYQDATRFGLTHRQARERYNRGTYNPLARAPDRRIPKKAPFYPVSVGDELKDRAFKKMRGALGDRIAYNDEVVYDAVYKHASHEALTRMANASADELSSWAEFQRKYSYTFKSRGRGRQVTPDTVRSLGFVNSKGKWVNVFWYH
jgi:hypothetical protein